MRTRAIHLELNNHNTSPENNEEENEEEDVDDFSINDDIFKGFAFYTVLIVLTMLLIHVIIWIWTRH